MQQFIYEINFTEQRRSRQKWHLLFVPKEEIYKLHPRYSKIVQYTKISKYTPPYKQTGERNKQTNIRTQLIIRWRKGLWKYKYSFNIKILEILRYICFAGWQMWIYFHFSTCNHPVWLSLFAEDAGFYFQNVFYDL